RAVARASEVEAANDPARDNLVDALPGRLLDDQPKEHEVGVGVRGGGTGLEQTTPLTGYLLGADERRCRGSEVRGDTARMVEQLPDRDRRASRRHSWKPVLDRVVEGQTAFTGELQHDGGDERLRRALDREAIVGGRAAFLELGPPGGAPPSPL